MFKVPAYSQLIDVKDVHWKPRSCGIVSLKMIMDYYGKKRRERYPSIASLIGTGKDIGAYIEHGGWRHKGLVRLAKRFGLSGKNYDWAKLSPKHAYALLKKKLTRPVIASIHLGLKPGGEGHLIVITGIKNGLVYYNDPHSKRRATIRRKASLETFLRGWKQRIIVIHP